MNFVELPKDILSIIFDYVERGEDIVYKNNLSMVCKRLYQIDKERRNNYWKKFTKKNPNFPLRYQKPYWNITVIDEYFDLVHEKLDIGPLTTGRLIDIHEEKNNKGFIYPENIRNIFTFLKMQKISKSTNPETSLKMKKFCYISEKDIALVTEQTKACPLISAIYLYFYDDDIVNAIMALYS